MCFVEGELSGGVCERRREADKAGEEAKGDAFSGQVQSGPDGVSGRATPAALVTLRMVPAQVRSLRLLVSISPWTPPGHGEPSLPRGSSEDRVQAVAPAAGGCGTSCQGSSGLVPMAAGALEERS